jgi:glyoxylase-like metal-dependent hydrolase (beta-lactamase superfamily II)
MPRHQVLAALVIAGAASIALGAAQQAGRGAPAAGRGLNFGTPSADALQVEKLSDTLFVLRGGGGNTAAFVSSTGVVLVDTKVSGWGQPILDKLKTLTDKPVTTIINTHTHFDHVNGNVEFPATVEVIAHENTKRLMEEWNPIYGLPIDNPSPFKNSGGRGLPKRTFKDSLTIGRGGDQVVLHHYGPAHTGGDTYVVFSSARVMHAGDSFANKAIPIIDRNNGGRAMAYPDTIARAAQTPGVDRVITGHGPTMTVADMREFSQFMRDFVTSVQQAKKSGSTVDTIVQTWKVPERYKGYNQPNPDSLRNAAQVAWDETR